MQAFGDRARRAARGVLAGSTTQLSADITPLCDLAARTVADVADGPAIAWTNAVAVMVFLGSPDPRRPIPPLPWAPRAISAATDQFRDLGHVLAAIFGAGDPDSAVDALATGFGDPP